MKTRTNLRAGDALQTCKQQKESWKSKAENMQRILANCRPIVNPPGPTPNPPSAGGGWVGGVWYADRSGICG
ncbi:MAG: hypothetical protein B6D39_06405 [Anaerolineae bacterium UTCFX2]|jgi:hypothetical protein|nr:hypothetical protein [Anaerolineae bacterium]OQY91579.1 MAG: hypothetical protein B6D39_06405 [Anaerolineae bacterium UTCFX2]